MGRGGEGLEAVEHRCLPRRSAEHRGRKVEAGDGRIVQQGVVGMDDDLHPGNGGMAHEGLDRVAQHRSAADGAILLRDAIAGADAAAAGDDQGMDDHAAAIRRPATGANDARRAVIVAVAASRRAA